MTTRSLQRLTTAPALMTPLTRSLARSSERLGNQARLRRLATGAPALQAKLTVGAVDDPLEHEADAVADHVMRMPDPSIGITSDPAGLRRKCAACEEDDRPLQRLAGGPEAATAGDVAPPVVHEAIGSDGAPLDPATHDFMQSRFGRDFGDVRIHADGTAARSAGAVGARAYTVGRDVVFGAGQYQPQTDAGRRLLAHELVHTVQQGAAGAPRAVSRKAMNGVSPIAISTGADLSLNRSPECPYTVQNCKGKACSPTSGTVTGFCGWSGAIATGCVCYKRDQPMLREFVERVIYPALMALGVVIALAALIALILCFMSGACEIAILAGALGMAAALLVIGLLKTAPSEATSSAADDAAASETAASNPAAAVATAESAPSSSMETS